VAARPPIRDAAPVVDSAVAPLGSGADPDADVLTIEPSAERDVAERFVDTSGSGPGAVPAVWLRT
jgi:hypothetical protein